MAQIAGQLSSFTRNEVKTLFAKANALSRNPFFTLLIAPKSLDFGRILIVTSRRIGSAPKRNLLKRRTRALFYEEKLFEYNYDCIIIFKKAATTLTFQDLKKRIMEAFSKL